MQEIRNIIFDFGGVILNIDFQRSIEAFQALGIGKDPSFFFEFGQSEIYSNLEKGLISEKDFYDHIRRVSGVQASDEDLRRAWDAVLLDMPEERVELLKKVRQHYRIFLLSNTNAIHYETYNGAFRLRYRHDFEEFFEKAYWSFRIGMRKPSPTTFQWVLNDAGLKASETLFIDDTLKHVEGARVAGIKGFHLHNTELTSLFDGNGKLKITL
ncbi:MAG: glucose-phosphatase [Bacteroidales bacterium]|jgi:putative hydrolase of the HAD superfamily|nr:glucose-phosphatase [Bacteroidales bacterium]MDN5328231.1 glucose-phosphatase [Bacteroidales bacterium]